MAIPLKNGADLYNFEVLRMRFHNLGADPASDFGVGQVYFNTSTSEGSGKRVRIYDGSAFRSLAYFDEIDNRLKLLEGEIDTDAIISNMKEVSAFLEGFAEDASLMDVLNGKLDKTGGTMTGNLTLESYLRFDRLKDGKSYLLGQSYDNNKTLAFYDGSAWRDILTSAGGTMNLASISSFMINRTDAGSPAIAFSSNGAYWGSIGFSSNGVPVFYDGGQVKYNFLHSGNVGEYAAGALVATSLNGLDLNSLATTTTKRNMTVHFASGSAGTTNDPFGGAAYGMLNIPVAQGYTLQLAAGTNQKMFARVGDATSWSAWKTIAFTDSNVASATKLETPRTIWGQSFDGTGDIEGNIQNVTLIRFKDSGIYGIYRGVNYSNNLTANDLAYVSIKHAFYTSGYQRLLINSSGNVTIGNSDLAGTSAKLYVDGHSTFSGRITADGYITANAGFVLANARYISSYLNNDETSVNIMGVNGNNSLLIGYGLQSNGQTSIYGTRIGFYPSGEIAKLIINESGNVGIGTTNPTEKLHVVGNLHVTGNIIADGEVSAGGAGEEGDTGTGTGGGDALIYSQEFTPTTTSITITHNLSATKGVIVQVWEKNGNYWDMVLVDVEEVDTNTVTLFFGKTETTLHKVVIMG